MTSTILDSVGHALPTPYAAVARQTIQELRSSLIREVANSAMGLADVLPFWFGEPDESTAEEVREVAVQRLRKGDTFYVQTLGVPSLRHEIARYVTELHRNCSIDNVAVTSSGTSGLMIAVQALVGPGDRVVAVTPLWPNLVEMPKILGAEVKTVSVRFDPRGWTLDLDKLIDALTPGTRLLLLNTPNNPTGWVMSADERRTVLAHCRQHGIWIISDDVYERYYFDGECAPSFLDFAVPEDRVVSCNSFSKAWLMTGWRVGWVVAPASLIPDLGKLIEFSAGCAPGFVQHAARHAMAEGASNLERTVARLRSNRDHLADGLSRVPNVRLAAPAAGAMYSFFRVEGMSDSLSFCKQMISKVGLGLAPGAAFGPEGEGYLRWCFASSHARLDDGIRRFAEFMRACAN